MSIDRKSIDDPAVDQQSSTPAVSLSSDEIVMVIEQAHVCYDYCAAWKESAQNEARADQERGAVDTPEVKQ